MTPFRRRNKNKDRGMEEARAAWLAADHDLKSTRARWNLVHTLTGKAHQVSGQTRQQRVTNHLGDLFAEALGEH